MLYENYQNKMKKFAGFVGTVRRFRVPIIIALALIAAVCAVLLSVRGVVYDVSPCPANVEYGSPLGYEADAVLAGVRYEYAAEGGDWSYEVPVRAGEYRVRAVSESVFGGKRYGKTHAFSILPKETDVYVAQEKIEYGALPSVTADLAYGDTISCTRFVYADISAEETEVSADLSAIAAQDKEGNDVSACYRFNPVPVPIGFTPRGVTVRVQDKSGIYDGTPLRFDGYELDPSTPLAEGDMLVAQFDDEQTDAGEGENIPEIRIKNVASGKDVTARYALEIVPGKLTVEKRPLYVTTESASKIYDGAPLTCGGYEIAAADGDSGLLAGHGEILLSSAALTDAGVADNVMEFRIEDESGRDVSANYSLFFEAGTLKVEKRQVFYSTGCGEWTYDGQPHSSAEYTVEAADENSGILPGHTDAPGAPAQVTDVGSMPNTSALRVTDAEGKDVGANYDFVCSPGTLTILPRPITVQTADGAWYYDGEERVQPNHAVTDEGLGLVAGHATQAVQCAKITDAGNAANTLAVHVFSEDGKNVTANYDITYRTGTLTVLPRPITVTAASAEKVYDGTALTEGGVVVTSEYDPALVAGHTYTAETAGSITDAGTADNTVTEFAVFGADGRDVSYNYSATFAAGTLTVHPRPITVTAASAEKVYDGTALTEGGVIVTSEYEPALVAGHTYTAKTEGSITDAGKAENTVIEFAVFDASGRNVTANYKISFGTGVLTVYRRPVTFKTASNEWIYDGEEHFDAGFALSESNENDPALVAGHRAEVWAQTVITDAGKSDNMLIIEIVAPSGLVMTGNYEISYEYGTLTVHPRPITVTAVNAEKVYDGLPLESTEIEISSEYDPALVADHRYEFYNSGTQTDAGQGTCTVAFFRIYNGENADMTANYEVTFSDGTLTVTRRPFAVMAGSDRKVYDGTPLTYGGWWISSAGFFPVEWHDVDVEIEGSITDAGTVPNVLRSVTVWENERDVTANYDITCTDGKLTVDPLPITLRAGSAAKRYDGTPLVCSEYEWIAAYEDRLLVKGHSASVSLEGSQTGIGESANTVVFYKIFSGERDVTKNYDVVCVDGSLRVLYPDYTLKIRTGSASKTYDGQPLTASECVIEENDLPEGFWVSAEAVGSIRRAGEAYNTVHLEVITPDGKDISRLIYVEYDLGILEVLPRPVTVRTASNSWEYDGESHYDDRAETTQTSLPLAEGDAFYCQGIVSIRYVGTIENALVMGVERRAGAYESEDVTDCYEISYIYGTLEITPSDLYDDINIGLPEGGGGGGGSGSGVGEATRVGNVYSQSGGMVYLRSVSYGDYTGGGWRSTIQYGELIDEKYSMNYLTSLSLQNAGRESGMLRLDMERDYVLPYYMAFGGENYRVQTSDVIYSGDTSEQYELNYYFYDHAEEGGTGSLTGRYADAEQAYRNFVEQNYLAVPESSRAYLNYVIREQGFDASDENIVSAVAEYVQGAAKYNLEYDRLLDAQTDIVVGFLRDFKEGICQHYASAATLIFRMLGIPARYTVGYAVDTEADEWTAITSDNAHAWVEIYVDGLGWVYVEVTGAGPAVGGGSGSGGGGGEWGPEVITIKPADEVKTYDGTPLTAGRVEGATSYDALLLYELSEQGYTYRAEFSGSRTEVGVSLSYISSFTLYDAAGKESDDYEFEFESGSLTVVEEIVVTVRPYAMQKQYDGTPLEYGANDYTVSGLPDGYSLSLDLSGVGLTDAGVLQKSVLEELPVAVYDAYGQNATGSFYICFDTEHALTVSRRAIFVASMSETKPYDGTPLTNAAYWLSGGSLAAGNTLSVSVTGSITDIGTAMNTIGSVAVLNADGKDVSANYRISVRPGTLTVV